MENKNQKIRCYKWIIVGIEIFVLGLLSIYLVIKVPYNRNLSMEEFNKSNNGEEVIFEADGIRIPIGMHQILCYYDNEGTNSDNSYFKISTPAIRAYFGKEIHVLPAEENVSDTTIYLSEPTRNFVITIRSGDRLKLDRIEIRECLIGRVYRVLRCFTVFVLIDFLIMLIWNHYFKISNEKKWLICKLVCVILFASIPILSDYVPAADDLEFHMKRIQAIAQSFQEGQFPVRVYSEAYRGYGYASSLFYGEIFLYIPAVLYLLGTPLYKAYQVYVLLMNIGTCLITYWCLKNMFRNKNYAVLGAFLYTCSAYRLLDVYQRASVGEYSAMMFMPLVVYALWSMVSEESTELEQKRSWMVLAIAYSGLIQTHILSSEMVLIFCFIAAIICIRRVWKRKVICQLLKAAITIILMNLWFMIPFIQYMISGNYTVNNDLVSSLGNSALYIGQIFNIFLKEGNLNMENGMAADMPFSLGLPLLIGFVLFILLEMKGVKRPDSKWKFGKIVTFLGGTALWMTSIYFPWDRIAGLSSRVKTILYAIQFPWRYLSIATILLTFTAVLTIWIVHRIYGKSYAIGIAGVMIASGILVIGSYYSNLLNERGTVAVTCYSKTELTFDNLYLPYGTDVDTFNENKILYGEELSIYDYQKQDGITSFTCINREKQEAAVIIPLTYYPNYVAYDAETGKVFCVRMSINHRVEVIVPEQYTGNIIIEFRIPWYWRMCECISILAVICVAICAVRLKRCFDSDNKQRSSLC